LNFEIQFANFCVGAECVPHSVCSGRRRKGLAPGRGHNQLAGQRLVYVIKPVASAFTTLDHIGVGVPTTTQPRTSSDPRLIK
jgi:hypothetical protein